MKALARPNRSRRTATFLLAAALTLFATHAWAGRPTDAFSANYDIDKSGLTLGQATFQLVATGNSHCYIYRGTATPNFFAHLFIGQIHEQSRFCVVDGVIQPQSFRHHENGRPKKSYTLNFNWNTDKIHYADEAGRHKDFPIKTGVQDPLSLQIAARRWLAQASPLSLPSQHTFRLADDDGISRYRVAVRNSGNVDTPAGRYRTVKLTRSGTHDHALTLWLARNDDWMPVRVRSLHHGKAQYTLTLKSLKRADPR